MHAVRGDARTIGLGVLTAPGPGGGLYVSIPEPNGSVLLVLLDATGRPQVSWPIELAGATSCRVLLPVDDGSVRAVCSPEELNRELNSGMRAFAFDSSGKALTGWPVDLDGSFTGRMVGDQLTLLGRRGNDVCDVGLVCGEDSMVTVAATGAVRRGVGVPNVGTCCGTEWVVGPDGVAYGVTSLTGWDGDSSSEVSRITAVDLSGVRSGWPVRIAGIASGPAFGPGGRIVLTVGSFARETSRVLVFNRQGKTVSPAAASLPIATAQSGVDCIAGGPQPPEVALDGTIVVYSEINTAVFAVDQSLAVVRGWPYRPGSPLEYPGSSNPGDGIQCSAIARPAVGPDTLVYLPLHARDAKVGGSIVAVGPNGRVRPGWPVELQRNGAEFWSVVVGADRTAFALALEPESGGRSSATILAIAPDGTVVYRTTIIDP